MRRWITIAAVTLATVAFFVLRGDTSERAEDAPLAPVDSAGAASVELVAKRGGEVALSYAVDVRDGLAAFGRGDRLVVVDVSNPAMPRELSSISVGGAVRDVRLAGRYAYAAADSAGLCIVDLSDPAAPSPAHTVRFDDRAYGVDIDGPHAYVAARSQGLRILEVPDSSAPREVGFIRTPDEAVDVVVKDRYAYVAAWYESMRVIDVSDPAAPKEVGFVSYDSYDNGAAWSVSVDGDLGLSAIPEMGLRTADVSDPSNARLHRVYRGLHAPTSAVGRGTTAFVADQEAGLRVLDVSDPAAPFEIGSLDVPGSALGVVLAGEHAFVAAREAGMRIVDVSRPSDPREISFVDADDHANDVVTIADTVLAVAGENGVDLVPLSDPTRTLSRLRVRGDRLIVHDGRYLIAVDGSEIRTLDLVDGSRSLTSPSTPPGHGPPEGVPPSLIAAGARGLVLVEPETGRTFEALRADRAGVGEQNVEALLRSPIAAWDVVADGRYAYAAFDDGIRVLDMTRPGSPSLVALHAMPQRVYALLRHKGLLLAACDDGLRVLDVTDPEELREREFHRTPSFATSLETDGSRVFVGDLSGAVRVFETEHDGTLRPAGRFEVAGRVLSLALTKRGLAVASGRGGLQIVALRGGVDSMP